MTGSGEVEGVVLAQVVFFGQVGAEKAGFFGILAEGADDFVLA